MRRLAPADRLFGEAVRGRVAFVVSEALRVALAAGFRGALPAAGDTPRDPCPAGLAACFCRAETALSAEVAYLATWAGGHACRYTVTADRPRPSDSGHRRQDSQRLSKVCMAERETGIRFLSGQGPFRVNRPSE